MNPDLLIPSLVALFVALIAGVVSLVVSILAKDQKISEFRQSWIDELRSDTSQLVSHFFVFDTVGEIIRQKTDEEIAEYVVSARSDFITASALVASVKLRLNPSEHTELIELLDADFHARDFDKTAHAKKIVNETQAILKQEWERVKRGESSFLWLKRISRFISILAILAVLFGAGMTIDKYLSVQGATATSECCDSEIPAPAES